MTETPTNQDSEEFYPEFHIVRRGYDPEQVEQVLDDLYSTLERTVREAEDKTTALRSAERARNELKDALTGAERRIAELERHPSDPANPSFESLGVSVAQILHAATAEAAEIRRRAHDEAQALHDESEATAVTSRVETDHYATDTRSRADAEAHKIVAQARAEAERLLTDARARHESQERAAVEAYEQRIASLTTRIDALAAELAHARGRAQVEADTAVAEAQAKAQAIVEEARQYRSKAHAEITSVHERIVAAMTAANLPVPESTLPVRQPRKSEHQSETHHVAAPLPDRVGADETPSEAAQHREAEPDHPDDSAADEPVTASRSGAHR
jgi:cell division septum initiation protein DivIVA